MSKVDPIEEAGLESFPASDPPAYSRDPISEAHPGVVWPYDLPALRFGYADLEPVMDEATLRLHHDRHHRAYVDTLNAALEAHPSWHGLTIEALLRRLHELPDDLRESVRNYGSGHANHQFFWKILRPPSDEDPSGALAEALTRDFGGVEAFKDAFVKSGLSRFGAGWVFLVARPRQDCRLEILSLPNQDSVLSLPEPAMGLLLCDVWEHAYYLKHQNRRADWLNGWWPLVDWPEVAARYDRAQRGQTLL